MHWVQTHQIPATFFELTTLMAFAHFAARNVDVAVIEVGIGSVNESSCSLLFVIGWLGCC